MKPNLSDTFTERMNRAGADPAARARELDSLFIHLRDFRGTEGDLVAGLKALDLDAEDAVAFARALSDRALLVLLRRSPAPLSEAVRDEAFRRDDVRAEAFAAFASEDLDALPERYRPEAALHALESAPGNVWSLISVAERVRRMPAHLVATAAEATHNPIGRELALGAGPALIGLVKQALLSALHDPPDSTSPGAPPVAVLSRALCEAGGPLAVAARRALEELASGPEAKAFLALRNETGR